MTIAIIEFNPFHDECLYSQVAFIKSNPANKVVMVYNHNLENRITTYREMIDAALPISSNQWGVGYLRILRFLKQHQVDRVAFNSVHYPQVQSLLRLASTRKRKYYGIVHDLQDFQSREAAQIDKKLSGYLVLNDYLLTRLDHIPVKKSRFAAFYPIFFPEIETVPIDKPDEGLWITIPGLVEASRRDYQKLLESLERGDLKDNIKLLFLGKSTFGKGNKAKIRKAFEEVDQTGQCVFWDDFIDLPTFYAYLKASDYLLPLLHANSNAGERYFDKITGLYNLGFAFGKRFLMENFLADFDDFKETAIFYSEQDDLVEFINRLDKPGAASPYGAPKFSFEYQAKNYLEFLQG